jgi:predicted PurR-regulated permease PerM
VLNGNPNTLDLGLGGFARRVALALLMVGMALALWRLAALAIIVFGAVLLAIGLRATTRLIRRAVPIGDAAALAIAIGGMVALSALVLWLFGSIIAGQVDELARQVPAGISLFAGLIETNRFARFAFEQARELSVSDVTAKAALLLAGAVRSLAAAIGYALVMLVVAVYIAAQPALYRNLMLKAVPPVHRARFDRLFDRVESRLRLWLIGQAVVMASISLLSSLGLWLLGIDAALALGLLSGMLSFIPYVGTLLSMVPAMLVAFNVGPLHVVWVVLLFCGVHLVEGDVITPLVQAEATSLPPVVSLVSIIIFGALFGPAGVLLAAPLALFFSAVLQTLYLDPLAEG